uniref:Uncharacterized protein n=1 Tax=Caenorhabditis japonica TaxID=281687 RepID=A0A8R1EWD8_CAEJA
MNTFLRQGRGKIAAWQQYRMASQLLINDSKYAFLKELGLKENNSGVFHGKWAASGQVVQSYAPASNSPIANVSYNGPK